MQITAIGLDIAKNVFQLHGIDDAGQPALRRKVRRDQLLERKPARLVTVAVANKMARIAWAIRRGTKIIAPGRRSPERVNQFGQRTTRVMLFRGLPGMGPLVIQHHPDRSVAHLRRKLVRRLAHRGSIYSRAGASGKPGAVHTDALP